MIKLKFPEYNPKENESNYDDWLNWWLYFDNNPEDNYWDLFLWSDYDDWAVFYDWEAIHNLTTFNAMRLWLCRIVDAKPWDVIQLTSQMREWLILIYEFVDWESDKLHLEYTDSDAYVVAPKPSDWMINRKQLIEEIYMWVINQIAKYYNRDWRYIWEWHFKESKKYSLYNFFDEKIEDYLIENWVKDVKKKVKDAKEKIWDESWLFTE